ncbi:sugar ABC transporter permease, partial [Mesorhizobium sp. M1233]|uniref:carbohydrate ABC transporter permease n=1 Tax=Mesorhizobium sp. M1233 TaxID=2957072 RepID=UPI00333C2600
CLHPRGPPRPGPPPSRCLGPHTAPGGPGGGGGGAGVGPPPPPNFIDNVSTVLPSLIVVNIWREFPFAMIMMMAGLQTVPDQLLRAAKVDGANAWQRFWHVTFPHLRNVSVVTMLLLAVANFNSFIIPWIMTGGGPSNASHIWITHIYELAFGRQRWGVASAYSVLLFLTLMTLGYFYVRALSGNEPKEGSA